MQNRSLSPQSDGLCVLKSQNVRIQDLSIQHQHAAGASDSNSSPPPAAPPAAPFAVAVASADATYATTTASKLRLSPLKRKHKRASLNPTAHKKTPLSDVVVAEGEFVVAEERQQDDGDGRTSYLHPLGSLNCVLVVKSGTALLLESVTTHSHDAIAIDVAQTMLECDSCSFALRFRAPPAPTTSATVRLTAYVFECATSAQCSAWVGAITNAREAISSSARRRAALASAQSRTNHASHNNSNRTTTSSNTSSNSSHGHCESQAASVQQSATTRRMQSIASLCDTPSQLSQPCPPALLPTSCSNFLYTALPRTKHILLVRHGHYINAHARGIPDSHQVLSQLGQQQAEFTGTYLEQLYARAPTRHEFTIAHSDLTRAVETAQTITKHFNDRDVPLHATRLLREGWPGRPYTSHEPVLLQQQQPQQAANTSARHAELERVDAARMELAFQTFFAPPGGRRRESDGDIGAMQRMDSRDTAATAATTVDSSVEQLSYHVIVCHANLIRFFLCRAMGVEPAGHWGHFEINHCGVTRIDVSEQRPLKIVSVNETGHLPHSLITSSEDHL